MERGVGLGKKIKHLLSGLVILFLIVWSLPALEGSHRDISIFEQLSRLGKSFFPPDLSIFSELLNAIAETLRIATFATIFGSMAALILSLAGSSRIAPSFIYVPVLVILAFIRSIPSLILAVLSVAVVGVNPFAGVLALSIYSIGYLGKFFLDILDQSDPRPAEWMRLHKAHPLQIFIYAQWPNLISAFWAKVLWMWEYNIRSASIIGYVGAGGIGLQLHIYQEYGQWNRFSTALLMIFSIVLFIELIHFIIRKLNPQMRI